MADPIQLSFFGWWRPPGAAAVTGSALVDGRLSARVQLTASDLDEPGDSATRSVNFALVGPGDVTGLGPRAVVHSSPASGAADAERDKAVYVELAAPDLPWRYTPALPSGKALRPWIVLLVGTSDEIDVAGSTVTLQPSVLDAHRLARSAMGGHVEQSVSNPNSPSLSRLVSHRELQGDRDHVAVIVPAFTAEGQPAWQTPAVGPVELPVYHHWSFRTRAGVDFATLARRLRLYVAPDDVGSADLAYGPLPAAPSLLLRSALAAPSAPTDTGVPAGVATDLTAVTVTGGDAAHPVLGLPDYGDPWPPPAPAGPPSGWRTELRTDPRPRAVAGLGAEAGIRHQDLLAHEAARLAGAYEEAVDRLRRLSLGLLVSRSLWRRRMPAAGPRRLAVLGPALRNVLSAQGPVNERIEHPQRGLSAAMLSSAARRAWRAGTPRSPSAGAGTPVDHGAVLRRAARAPAAPKRSAGALAHTDDLARALGREPLDDRLARPVPSTRALRTTTVDLAQRLDRRGLDPETVRVVDARLKAVVDRLAAAGGTAILPLLRLVDAPRPGPLTRERARAAAAALDAAPDSADLAQLGALLARQPAKQIDTAFDLDRAATSIAAAFDPTVARPAMVDRVVGGIKGITGEPLTPQELKPELELPAWRFLRDEAPDWLLQGADELPNDSVVALTTNPAFVDAFLLGLNAQVVAELRFRNLPIIPGWTPMRTFWDRANPGTGAVDDDIAEVADWPENSPFGSSEHQAPSAASADLVVLFNTPLFREYPGTLVYLVPAARRNGQPDWVAEPQFGSRLFPSFQGQLSAERVFFGFDLDPALVTERWVVLEEVVKGRRFWNAAAADALVRNRIGQATNGGDLAAGTVVPPRRVMIRGDILLGGRPA